MFKDHGRFRQKVVRGLQRRPAKKRGLKSREAVSYRRYAVDLGHRSKGGFPLVRLLFDHYAM